MAGYNNYPMTDEEFEGQGMTAEEMEALYQRIRAQKQAAGPAATASVDTQGADQELRNWIEVNIVGHGPEISRTLKSKDVIDPRLGPGFPKPNYNPIYRHTFKDNTYLDVQWDNTQKQWRPLGGTALKEGSGGQSEWEIYGEFDPKTDFWYYERNKNTNQMRKVRNTEVDMVEFYRKLGQEDLKKRREEIAAKIDEGTLTARQAELQYQKERDAVQTTLEKASQELTKRGQDLNFGASIAGDASAMAREQMGMMVPKGWSKNFEKALSAIGTGQMPGPVEPMGPIEMPFDPMQVPNRAAMEAIAHLSPSAAQALGRKPSIPNGYTAGPGPRAGQQPQSQGNMNLDRIYQIARQSGLDDDGARVAMAIAQTEGGLSGAVGDKTGGGSYGPFQFYAQGQLTNFAKQRGMSVQDAGQYVLAHPEEASQWALGGYLGNAIRQGQQQGLRGPSLATYAQQHGQVSVSPERAGQNYLALFGQGGAPTQTTVELSGAPAPPRMPTFGQQQEEEWPPKMDRGPFFSIG